MIGSLHTNKRRAKSEECRISCLPPELLALIFILAQAESKSNRHPLSSNTPFEVILSHVSRRWRAVSLTTRTLWNQIDIYTPLSLHLASSYLERSGPQILLDIHIDLLEWEQHRMTGDFSESLTALDIIQSIGDHIIPHLYRIRSLLFTCFSESTCLNMLLILRNASAPNLRQLEIKFDYWPFVPMLRNRLCRFRILQHGSSQLAFFKTDQAECMPVITSLRGLTSLHLGKLHTDMFLTYPTLVEVLTAPDCLLYLSIEGAISRSIWPRHFNAPDFQLHHLKALRICDQRTSMPATLLLTMSAPKLESLWLECNFKNLVYLSWPTLGPSRFPKPRYLTLSGVNPPFVVPLCTMFLNTTHLHLHRVDVQYFRDLESTLSGPWSSLHTLIFTTVIGDLEVNWENIGHLMTSRLPRHLSRGRLINNLLVDRDILHVFEKEVPSPIETKVQLVSKENYMEPWWNQEDQPNAE